MTLSLSGHKGQLAVFWDEWRSSIIVEKERLGRERNEMKRQEIIRKILENEKNIRDLGVETLFLFGSAVRDDLLPESDIDILVSFAVPADYRKYINLKFFLEEILDRPVDLVMESALKPRIRKKVESEMIRVA